MSTQELKPCCVTGHLHTGTPEGHVAKIAGLDVYVSPPTDGSKAKSVVFIHDIFGWELNNVRLLADEFAKAGFYVYVPDFFKGDPISESFLQTVAPRDPASRSTAQVALDGAKIGATLMPWLAKHPESTAKPLIDGFIAEIRKDAGTGKVGVVGFCWGGRYVLLLAKEGSVDAAVSDHPSLTSSTDFEGISVPTQLNVGTNDAYLSNDVVSSVQSSWSATPLTPTDINVYNDAVHGFAIRADLETEREKVAKDDVTAKSMTWLAKYLA